MKENFISATGVGPASPEIFSKIKGFAYYTARYGSQALRQNRARWEGIVSLVSVVGDLVMILAGFVFAFWLRYTSGLLPSQPHPEFPPGPAPVLFNYWKLVCFGTAVIFCGSFAKGFHEYKDLLAPGKALTRFVFILSLGLFAFIGVTLAVRTDPPISRIYVVCCWFFVLFNMCVWRHLLSRLLQHPALVLRLRKRLVVIGAGLETLKIKHQLAANPELELVGWVQGNKPNRFKELEDCRLGALHELDEILRRHGADVAVLTESESLQREGISFVAKVCEREHVQFKMVPHFFEILICGLRPSVVGGVPVLGVDSLPLNAYENRIAKRALDILGASVGLLLACPLILFFGILVFLESPGPIFYRQVRCGRHGRLFGIYKIRSMKINCEGNGAQWAKENDPRRLKIGAFMRRWNLDEIPQFWNVLKGDMSLVGPRPERPELIDQFKFVVPHYQTRHNCRPGMSGWAQVNGWRGNTSLEERIRCDIWYVENWDIFLDLRIMLLTFVRVKNAY